MWQVMRCARTGRSVGLEHPSTRPSGAHDSVGVSRNTGSISPTAARTRSSRSRTPSRLLTARSMPRPQARRSQSLPFPSFTEREPRAPEFGQARVGIDATHDLSHPWRLTIEAFAARHAAQPQDIDAIVRFAEEHGLTVTYTNPVSRIVRVAGPAGEVMLGNEPRLLPLFFALLRGLRFDLVFRRIRLLPLQFDLA